MNRASASVLVVVWLLAAIALHAEDQPSGSESALLTNVRQVTFEGRRAGEGYFSSDGKMMVFQSERDPENPFFQIFLLDLETGDTERVSPGTGKTTCSWVHPDGRHVMFASTHGDPAAVQKQQEELQARAEGRQKRYSWDYDENFELYSADLETGKFTRLTDAVGYDAEGSYSPDGRLIAFSSNRHAYLQELSQKEKALLEEDKSYFLDIYIMNADGSNIRRLTNVPGYDGGPFFSADGSRICWRRFAEDGATAEIFTMNVDGSDQRQLTHMGAMSWAPYFHPSGDYLIFATNTQGFANFELYLVDAGGSREPVRATYTDGFDGLPSFTPDGSTLTWTSNRSSDGTSQIFFADWNDEAARSLLGLAGTPATTPDITSADLRAHVERLASDEMEGRLTGTAGEKKATEYVARALRSMGIQPAGDDGSYFQEFEFTSGVSLGSDNRLRLAIRDESYEPPVDQEWRPLAYSKTGPIEQAPVIFAGYGLVAPAEGAQDEYDSYVHLDVSGKWVMLLRYLPEQVSPERRQHLARYSGIRYKALMARERGAIGILVVSGPTSKVEKQLVDLSFDSSLGATSIAVLSVSDSTAERLLAAGGKELASVQASLDSGEPAMGFEVSDSKAEAVVDLVYEKKKGRNVIGRLAASQPSSHPALLLGAHLDHLGRGIGMSTLARDDEKGQIHYGADDNASGASGLLEIAEYLSSQAQAGKLKPKRDVLFGFWSGEELGLLGSSNYTQRISEDLGNPTDISGRLAAYLNLDMIGRLQDKLILQGVGSSSVWTSEIEKRNAPIGLSVATQNDSYLPTDATSFYLKRVPILSAFTGTHSEYHSPRDTPDTLDYDSMAKVTRLMALIGRSIANSDQAPDYVEMKRPAEGQGRAKLRAYLGTIPDYAQGDVTGLKLSGVISGGPAEAGGLQGGDIIVELAGRTIENIYDYTYAIEALKIGQPVKIVAERNGERLTFEVTPGSRE